MSHKCTVCERKLENIPYFSTKHGTVCYKCHERPEGGLSDYDKWVNTGTKYSKLYPTKSQNIIQSGNTLRLHPQNNLIAFYDKHRGHWVCDPDLAVPLAYQLLVKAALSVHEIKWSHPDTHKLYNAVSHNKDTIAMLEQLEVMELIMEGISHD